MDPNVTRVISLFPRDLSEDGKSIPADEGPMRPIVSPEDILDLIRELDGEDEETGYLWGEEYVVDADLELPGPADLSLPAAETWTPDERKKLIGRATNELLIQFFRSAHGERWYELEPEVLIENLVEGGATPDAGGLERVLMLHALCQPPLGRCPFYADPYTFRFASVALSGRPSMADDPVLPTPLEMSLAIKSLLLLRPSGFSPEVKGFIAAACVEQGLWCLPLQLSVAQPKVYKIAESMGFDITPARVSEIQGRVAAEYEGVGDLPEVPDTEDDAQCLRVLDLIQRIDLANLRADRQVDRFFEQGTRYYRGEPAPQDTAAEPT